MKTSTKWLLCGLCGGLLGAFISGPISRWEARVHNRKIESTMPVQQASGNTPRIHPLKAPAFGDEMIATAFGYGRTIPVVSGCYLKWKRVYTIDSNAGEMVGAEYDAHVGLWPWMVTRFRPCSITATSDHKEDVQMIVDEFTTPH